MTDIFLSYASEDRPWARKLAEALRNQGWSVWWDREIPFAKPYDEVIEEELAAAGAVVTIWSKTSVKKRWVRSEAGEGLNRNVLLTVLMEEVRPPIQFSLIQGANLTNWQGETGHPEYKRLLTALTSLLKKPPHPEVPESSRAAAKHKAEEQERAATEAKRKAVEKEKGQSQAAAKRKAEKQAQEDDELDSLWTDALAEFHTQDWERAVELLAEIVERRTDFRNAASKLQIAKRQLELDTLYANAKTAFDTGSWATAVELFSKIIALDSDYKDSQVLLAKAQCQVNLAVLYAEGCQLHRAKKWAAVVKVFEKIHRLQADYPDPDDLLQTAQAEVQERENKQKAVKLYREALQHMDADELKEAQRKLLEVRELLPDYKETQALLSRIQELLGTLSLRLSANPRQQFEGLQVKWTVSLRNKGHNPIREVTVTHGKKVLAKPFEMPAGKARRFTFEKTYRSTGRKTEKVKVTFVLSSGATQEESKTETVEIIQPMRKATKEKAQVSQSRPENISTRPYGIPPVVGRLQLTAPVLDQPTDTLFARTWTWTSVLGAAGYVLERSKDASFEKPTELYRGEKNKFIENDGKSFLALSRGIPPRSSDASLEIEDENKSFSALSRGIPSLIPITTPFWSQTFDWYYRVRAVGDLGNFTSLGVHGAWSNVVGANERKA